MPLRFLIIGASGQVGHHLMKQAGRRGHRAFGTFANHADHGLERLNSVDREATIAYAKKVKPDWIISTVAWPHVDGCENDPEKARMLNVDTTRHAAEAAAELGAGLLFYSSDYVYDGTQLLVTEAEEPNPLSVYGRVKLEAEQAAQALVPDALIIRTAVVYGPERREKNTVYQMIRAALEGRKYWAATDQLCNPTYSPNLAAASIALAEQRASGIFHVAGVDIMSRHEFSLMACDVFDIHQDVLQPMTTAEMIEASGGSYSAPRPLQNGMDVSKAATILPMRLFTALEGLTDFKHQAPAAWMASRID